MDGDSDASTENEDDIGGTIKLFGIFLCLKRHISIIDEQTEENVAPGKNKV